MVSDQGRQAAELSMEDRYAAIRQVRELLEGVGIACAGSGTAEVLLPTSPALREPPEVVALDSEGAVSATVRVGPLGGRFIVWVPERNGEPKRMVMAPSAAHVVLEVPGYRDATLRRLAGQADS